jgi:hypothetical protein
MGGTKMMAKCAFLALLVWLVAGPAAAADTILTPTTDYAGCKTWKLCDDQASGTTCVTGALNNIVRGDAEWFWSAWADTSDSVTAWTVNLYAKTRGSGYGTVRAHLTYLGAMTPSAPSFHWSGHGGDVHGVLGGTLTNGVTVILQGCEPSAGGVNP